jgi:Zn-dependent metalloprotease
MVFTSRSLRPAIAATAAGLAAFAGVGLNASGANAVQPAAPKPSPAQSRSLAAQSASNLISAHEAALHVGASDTFVAKQVISSGETQYVPYERTYKGLPVYGGDFVVVTDANGNVTSTSVAQTSTIGNLSTTPKVSSDRAETIAKSKLSKVDSVSRAQQIVYALGTPRLAWETRVNGFDGDEVSSLSVYVDAISGKVLGSKEHVLHGNGTGAYSGPNPLHLDTTLSGSTYYMQDPNNSSIKCQDNANSTTFSGPDDNWGNGDASVKETGCVDGLFAVQTENKMLSQWLGRNGMDGNGTWVPLRVGLADVNAYYDGTQVKIGHNQDSPAKWISSIDVVAHEFAHGIDDHTPGGISGGGTQEFVADVFGAVTEGFSNQSSPYDVRDYLVGEEVNLVGQGPIRNMYNPGALGDPNCYSSSIPNTEVHSAAGPGNHWFYLLAEGTNPTNGQPTSSTCNGSSNLVGVGVQTAAKIMYNAMLMKTTSSSYLKYRTWTLTSAKNLDSTCGLFNKVKAAWDAVSVPAQTGDPTCSGTPGGVTVNNPGNKSGTVGTAITSFTVTASGGTTPYTWSATGLPAGITIGSSSGTVSGTPTTAGTYNVTVTATDSASQTGSTSFTFTISPTGGGCSGQKITNPGFESGSTGWSATSGVIGQWGSQGEPTHGGTWNAWLDGYGTTHTDALSQSVTIPSGCGATLSFYLHIDSSETTTSVQYDKLTVKLGSTTLATYSNLNKASGYSLKSFNVSSFAGQTVTLNFTGTEDVSLQTSFVVDDTALTLS